MNTRDIGLDGEERATAWLIENGSRIILRNFRKRAFEIDIIAIDKDNVLRFTEVKNIVKGNVPDAVFSVENRNILRYLAAVDCFLSEHPQYINYKMCMDLIIVCSDQITRYENITSCLVV